MFFGGGISGFFQDLYYGAVEKSYIITHPEIWDINTSTGTSSQNRDKPDKIMAEMHEKSTGNDESVDLIEKKIDIDSMSWEE